MHLQEQMLRQRRSMDVLWVVLVVETCSTTRTEWAGNTLFYVLRLILRVGTLRAQYSECVPSHSFTPIFYEYRSTNDHKITRACVCAWIIRQSSDAAFVRKYCVFAHKFLRNSIFSLLRIHRLLISQPTYR
jgi:hypothetical protein